MLFNSYTFFIFFAVVLLVSRLIGNWTARKSFLLLVSYLFYAAWNPPFVILLWISTLIDWFVSKTIAATNNRHRKFVFLLISLFVNLGMLAYFKYGTFAIENFNAFSDALGLGLHCGKMDIILPVGISFYTFQTLSYTLDVYFDRIKPWSSFLDYALYVTFFPQLVAGPIVRAPEFLEQCKEPRKGTSSQIGWGLCLFIIGLFAKVVLADLFCAPTVEKVYNHSNMVGFLSAWTGTLAFAMQIFYDFFGYSTCAIGVALCLGFELPDNFRFPYAACGFSDFWKRWHISLSSWLRDYLYIPLGGNRKGPGRTHINLMLTMLLGGLWHGASWMFVIWGGLHGLYLIGEKMLCESSIAKWRIWQSFVGQLFLTLLTFFLVCITWVFFRSGDLTTAFEMIRAMLDPRMIYSFVYAAITPHYSITIAEPVWLGFIDHGYIFIISIASLFLHFRLKNSSFEEYFGKMNILLRAILFALMMYLTFISMGGEDNAFIYFQF
ncbi:MAG: MBOAT family protein [Planctomycetes bacterium]|nr:MBOAT family protein [Planctomycetota bacterium]